MPTPRKVSSKIKSEGPKTPARNTDTAVTRSTRSKASPSTVLHGPTNNASPSTISVHMNETKGTPQSKKKRKAAELEETPVNGQSPRTPKRQKSVDSEVPDSVTADRSPKKGKKEEAVSVKEEIVGKEVKAASSSNRNKKIKRETDGQVETKLEEEESETETKGKVKRKRKTKEEKEAEAMPLAARTTGLRMFVGAHVSCAKGVQNSVTNAEHIGGNAFAMFLKSQRKWDNPPLQDEHRSQFKEACSKIGYDARQHIIPHGSYLVNLAQEEKGKAQQAYDAFLEDLKRCDALGISNYNFHPGSTGSAPRPEAIGRIASALNRCNRETKLVAPVLEAMAGQGNVIGSTFEDLRDIINLMEDKSRIGVCIDTCHIFAAGYDLRSPTAFKSTLEKFDRIVGMGYLRALHINDSKAPLGSHRDLHQNVGLGFLGLRAFHNVMNEPRFENLPLVLETPIDRKGENGKEVEDKSIWAREIKLLESLIGMDPEGKEFRTLEKDLAAQGAEERKKHADAFERKKAKDQKVTEKGQSKLSFGTKRVKEESEGE